MTDLARFAIEILEEMPKYEGRERCYVSAYQLAVLCNERHPQELPVGGAGIGEHRSLAQRIAAELREAIRNGNEVSIEAAFFSTTRLDGFTFDGGHEPSNNSFSIFRLLDKAEGSES